jgi:hypothetical protein
MSMTPPPPIPLVTQPGRGVRRGRGGGALEVPHAFSFEKSRIELVCLLLKSIGSCVQLGCMQECHMLCGGPMWSQAVQL